MKRFLFFSFSCFYILGCQTLLNLPTVSMPSHFLETLVEAEELKIEGIDPQKMDTLFKEISGKIYKDQGDSISAYLVPQLNQSLSVALLLENISEVYQSKGMKEEASGSTLKKIENFDELFKNSIYKPSSSEILKNIFDFASSEYIEPGFFTGLFGSYDFVPYGYSAKSWYETFFSIKSPISGPITSKNFVEKAKQFSKILTFEDFIKQIKGNSDSVNFQGITEHLKVIYLYYFDYLKNDYKDRNGTKIEFDSEQIQSFAKSVEKQIKSRKIQLDEQNTSPQVAGQLAYVLVDSLGDCFFKVPFYSKEIIHLDNDIQENTKNLASSSQKREELKLWLKNNAPPLENGMQLHLETRLQLEKLQKEDQNYLELSQKQQTLQKTKQEILLGSSSLQKSYTCFNAFKHLEPHPEGAPTLEIRQAIEKVYLKYTENGEVKTGGDYADLLGKLVAYASRQAEKQTRTSIGGLIRGLSQASLDNEVIAEIIASIAGCFSKKVTEQVVYSLLKEIIENPSIQIHVKIRGKMYDKKYFFEKLAEALEDKLEE